MEQRQFKRGEYCHTCGTLRGIAPYRESVTIQDLVSMADHKEMKHDPSRGIIFEQQPQLTVHVGIWRNGGGDGENYFLCDDCLKIGLRHALAEIKVLLGDRPQGVTDGGWNPFYEGLFPGESEADRDERIKAAEAVRG